MFIKAENRFDQRFLTWGTREVRRWYAKKRIDQGKKNDFNKNVPKHVDPCMKKLLYNLRCIIIITSYIIWFI